FPVAQQSGRQPGGSRSLTSAISQYGRRESHQANWRPLLGRELTNSRSRLNAERFLDRRRLIYISVLDHGGDIVDVTNVLRRIAIDQNHVRHLAGGNDPIILVNAHD